MKLLPSPTTLARDAGSNDSFGHAVSQGFEAVMVIVIASDRAAVGVPLITPVAASNDAQVGNPPAVMVVALGAGELVNDTTFTELKVP